MDRWRCLDDQTIEYERNIPRIEADACRPYVGAKALGCQLGGGLSRESSLVIRNSLLLNIAILAE